MSIIANLQSGKKSLLSDLSDRFDNSQVRQYITYSNSLRSRGYVFIGLVIIYTVFIAVFFFSQRAQPLQQLEQYQNIEKTHEALVQTDLVTFQLVTVLFSEVTQSELNQIFYYFSTLRQQYQNLASLFPEQADAFRKLEQSFPEYLPEPQQIYLQKVRLYMTKLKTELNRLMTVNQTRMTGLIKDYRQHEDSLVIKSLLLGCLGLALIGIITTFLFKKLKLDLLTLQQRSAEILKVFRGTPLPINLQDELEKLCDGINLTPQTDAERERALEIKRRMTSFREKMITIDALAGGIAHEVGNPITCITGLAQEIANDGNNQLSEDSKKRLLQLQQYTEGIAGVTRDLSMLDTQSPDESEWIDINQLLTKTVNLCHYDNRWSNIAITLDPDHGLPAIIASRNLLNQLITHILENALDALLNQNQPKILLQTKSYQQNGLTIVIQDNGVGVKEDDLQHIFEPFYTTKTVGHGTGLGLAICWKIVKSHHGSIRAEPLSTGGLKITIDLPGDDISQFEI